ncbi:MAG: gamma-glutamylcyclotransferase family protein [Chloroflexota bacterium]
MDKKLYFAYGSNLNLDQMKSRCPDHEVLIHHTLKNFRLLFRSVADIEEHSGSRVQGVIFKISKGDEESLDIYEGVPKLYSKKYFTLKLDKIEASVLYYKMNVSGIGKPTDNYYNSILKGYKQNNLDINLLKQSLEFSIQNTKQPIFFSNRWKD